MIVSRTSCISDTVLTIVKEFIHYNVLEDRLEYSVEDLACSFPSCTELEITELYNLLQDQL